MKRLLRWLGFLDRAHYVSDRWLSDEARRGSRIEFHAPAVSWPIRKFMNEAAQFQTQKLKKRA